MTYIPLSSEVLRLHELRAHVPAGPDIKHRAGYLAIAAYGDRALDPNNCGINLAALALSFNRLVIYRPQPSVIEQVAATDLHSTITSPPRLLRGPFVIESPKPDQSMLFADVSAIAGYCIGDRWWIIYWRHPDGVGVFEWDGQWSPDDMGVNLDNHAYMPDVEQWGENAQQSVRFAIVLGLLLDAEGSPVQQQTLRPQKPPAPKFGQKRPPGSGWETRYLTLPAIGARHAQAQAEAPGEREVSGLHLIPVAVRGFLRRQPYGPNSSLRKWIYISGHESRRWVSPAPVAVSVSRRRED